MINDFCKFFKDIERDPRQNVQMTVRELLKARQHIYTCEECYLIAHRIADSDKSGIEFGMN